MFLREWLTYHPDIGAGFKLSVYSETTKSRIHFQSRTGSQICICVQTDSNDNVICFNLNINKKRG